MAYEPIKFPSWRFHRTEPARIVNDPIEEEALGDGWADTPAAFADDDEPAEPATPEAVQMAALRIAAKRRKKAAAQ